MDTLLTPRLITRTVTGSNTWYSLNTILHGKDGVIEFITIVDYTGAIEGLTWQS